MFKDRRASLACVVGPNQMKVCLATELQTVELAGQERTGVFPAFLTPFLATGQQVLGGGGVLIWGAMVICHCVWGLGVYYWAC